METWLITGGAGFIGSNLVAHVLAKHPEIHLVVFDALTYAGHLCSLQEALHTGRCHFVHGDVADAQAFRACVQQCQPRWIFHLAAESHVDRSLLGPEVFAKSNVQGTLNVLETARQVRVPRTVIVSTDEVYGSLGPTGHFHEDDPMAPSSPYSASKASGDLFALAYHRSFGLDVVITRCTNNFGPYQLPEKLLPFMVLNALKDLPLPLYGDGSHVRDWLHVRDHCRALLLAAEKGRPGRVYNVGGHNEYSNLALVQELLALLGKPQSLIRHVADRPGHDARYAVCTDRAKTELGFVPEEDFARALRETVAWYQNHPDWCQQVRSQAFDAHLQENYGHRIGDLSAW